MGAPSLSGWYNPNRSSAPASAPAEAISQDLIQLPPTISAFFNVMKTLVGAGILTLPYATARVGLVLSAMGFLVLACLSQFAIHLLVQCVVHEKEHGHEKERLVKDDGSESGRAFGSWAIVASAAFGVTGKWFTVTTLCIAQFGLGVIYLDVVCDTLLAYSWEPGVVYISVWILLSILCLVRPLRSVACLSAAALAVYLYVFVLLFVFGSRQLQNPVSTTPLRLFDASGFGAWFGPSVFAFTGCARDPTCCSKCHWVHG